MLASLLFYAWDEPRYVFILLLSIVINYAWGLIFYKTLDKHGCLRKLLMFFAVSSNLLILIYYKYMNFAVTSINTIFNTAYTFRNIILPIGISFFTFQGISYIIDVYRRKVDVQKNPVTIAFYISFFPQLLAGPIVRYTDIKDQIQNRTETVEKFVGGAKRFIVGLAKKVLIADTLGFTADRIFQNPAIQNTPATAWLGVLLFQFQVYFDFSGYSDMAIGLANIFGFNFRENFNYPNISKTLTEYWRRWHISLSTWFRDYVYFPLGGSKRGNVYINLLIVFVIVGLWHGASFSFIVWGLWNGLFLIIEQVFKIQQTGRKILVPIRFAVTMTVVLIGRVLFRDMGMSETLAYIGIMFGAVRPENAGFTTWHYLSVKIAVVLAIAVVASTPIIKTKFFITVIASRPSWKYVSAVLALALLLVSLVFAISSTYTPFIYFRF